MVNDKRREGPERVTAWGRLRKRLSRTGGRYRLATLERTTRDAERLCRRAGLPLPAETVLARGVSRTPRPGKPPPSGMS